MGLENFDYSEVVDTKANIKEELGDLKSKIDKKEELMMRDNPKKAFLFWLSESGHFPNISIDNKPNMTFSVPSIVEDVKFHKIVDEIEKKLSYRTSLYTLNEVLYDIDNLPDINLKYVAPDGKDLIMKFGFIKNPGGGIIISPFVKDSGNGKELSFETDSDYTISVKLDPENNWERTFKFELKE